MKNKLITILTYVILISLFTNCNDDDSKDIQETQYQPAIDATNLPAGNRPMTMFEDNENEAKMYDNNDRWFKVNEPMQIILKGKDSVQISLYSPVALTDVKVYAKLPSIEKRFLLFSFTKVPAFHRSFHQIPLVAKSGEYEMQGGGTVKIDQIDGFLKGEIEFSIESEDPFYAKFRKIKSHRLVQFSDKYHLKEPGKFLPMNPVLAKEAITMIINYSYAISHPIYYDTFTNFDRYKEEQAAAKESSVTGALNLHGNKADSDGIYDYLSKSEIKESYNKYIDERIIEMAMVGRDTAWGGGKLVSHWEYNYIEGHWTGVMSTWSHEYSHHCGYSHTSNLANSNDGGGVQEMLANFYKYLIYIDDLPFTDPDILKSYTKKSYLLKTYKKPVFTIKPDNPFLLKYKGKGKWE